MSDEFKYCNQNDYVSRENLYIEFRRHFTAPKDWRKLAKFVIDATPPADVAPVVHGRWVEPSLEKKKKMGLCGSGLCRCSVCRHEEPVFEEYPKYNYCPNCGAKMESEGEE